MSGTSNPDRKLSITKHVVNAYIREPGSDVDTQAEGMAVISEMFERVTNFNAANVGLNKNVILTAKAAYIQELILQGKPIDEDPILAFMDRQLRFNNEVCTTLTEASNYSERLRLAKKAEEKVRATLAK